MKPAAHAQAVWPRSVPTPAVQAVHELAADTDEKVLAAQLVQDEAPAGAYVPAMQATHPAALVAPLPVTVPA